MPKQNILINTVNYKNNTIETFILFVTCNDRLRRCIGLSKYILHYVILNIIKNGINVLYNQYVTCIIHTLRLFNDKFTLKETVKSFKHTHHICLNLWHELFTHTDANLFDI